MTKILTEINTWFVKKDTYYVDVARIKQKKVGQSKNELPQFLLFSILAIANNFMLKLQKHLK